jgi:hypothetical protein
MNRLNKKVEVTIDPRFSWVDWELYEVIGTEAAAEELNEALETAVNAGISREGVEREMLKVRQELAEFGAMDSESFAHLRRVLDVVFLGTE